MVSPVFSVLLHDILELIVFLNQWSEIGSDNQQLLIYIAQTCSLYNDVTGTVHKQFQIIEALTLLARV